MRKYKLFPKGAKFALKFYPKENAFQHDVYEVIETVGDCFVMAWGPYLTPDEAFAARERLERHAALDAAE